MSALLRAIRYADDASYRLAGYRKLDPITTAEAEARFLKAAEALFLRGASNCGRADCRLATWFGSGDTGRNRRHQPPHRGGFKVLCRFVSA